MRLVVGNEVLAMVRNKYLPAEFSSVLRQSTRQQVLVLWRGA